MYNQTADYWKKAFDKESVQFSFEYAVVCVRISVTQSTTTSPLNVRV